MIQQRFKPSKAKKSHVVKPTSPHHRLGMLLFHSVVTSPIWLASHSCFLYFCSPSLGDESFLPIFLVLASVSDPVSDSVSLVVPLVVHSFSHTCVLISVACLSPFSSEEYQAENLSSRITSSLNLLGSSIVSCELEFLLC